MKGHLVTATASVLIATAVAGGFALAAIPSSGVISGCYQKNQGQLRVVDSAADCHSSEVPLSWNQTGVGGSQGATGATGPIGATGVQGPKGDTGTQGAMGDTGTAGTNGTNGATGATGATGAGGPMGATGASALSGYQIVTGPTTQVGGLQDSGDVFAFCPTGKLATGGGAIGTGALLYESAPVDPSWQTNLPAGTPLGGGWFVRARNNDLGSNFIRAYVICMKAN